MRGFALNRNLLAVGATFVHEALTATIYRLWSIDDQYPAMLRVTAGGAAIALEVWAVPVIHLGTILLQEPPGLCLAKFSSLISQSSWEYLGRHTCARASVTSQRGVAGGRIWEAVSREVHNARTLYCGPAISVAL